MMSNRQIIGRKVANLRTLKGMTQYELAVASGISSANVSKIERGVYNVSIDILSRVCKALDAEITIMSKRMQ